MNPLNGDGTQQVSALLICPDAELAAAWHAATAALGQLLLAGESREYPAAGRIDEMLRGREIDAVLIDVGGERRAALEIVREITDRYPATSVVGLARGNDPETILQCLRAGAAEFLAGPFPEADVKQALQRILRRRAVEARPEPTKRGRLLAFAPVKGGSGATTLASNIAFRVRKESKSRVLLADLNLSAGVISFLLRLKVGYTAIDALRHSSQLDESLWKSLVVERLGIDILAAPERPEPSLLEPYPAQEMLDFARSLYDWVIVDLGSVCEPLAMTVITAADQTNLVCSTDMTSLFMMRRTIPLLEEMGKARDQINVLVNRLEKRPELQVPDMEKIFRASVHATFAEDAAAVQRAQREAVPVADGTELGRGLSRFVKDLLGKKAPAESAGAFGSLKSLLGGA